MKPLSPILMLTAVHAAVYRQVRRGTDPGGLDFVQQLGVIAHMDGPCTSTSWPLAGARSVADLLQRARTYGMVRKLPQAGDLVAFGTARVGVVLAVLDRGIGEFGRTTKCSVAMATSTADGREDIGVHECWCGTGRGDVFIRWHEVDGETRRAA
jgi:hypothetical protein